MSNETKPTVADIVANPELYGFSWLENETVQKGDNKWTVPLVKHNDVDLLIATFGRQFFLDSADGTSRHVTNQRIARDIKADKPLAKAIEIKTAIVENMLGMKAKRRTVVEVTKYDFQGVSYATREERDAAATRILTQQGYNEEMVKTLVGMLSGSTQNV